MPDPEEVFGMFVIAVLVLLVGGLLAAGGFAIWRSVQRDRAQDHCGALGGKVEHYDPQHTDLWRCVGARAEGE